MLVRGRWLTLTQHAFEGMQAERPPIRVVDVALVLEEPDHDQATFAWKRIGPRTVLVYYEEQAEALLVRAVSATRSRLAP
jgi:hypothetical protein